jgi:hypothetical protein
VPLIAAALLALTGSAELGSSVPPPATTTSKQDSTAQLGFALAAETVVSPGKRVSG